MAKTKPPVEKAIKNNGYDGELSQQEQNKPKITFCPQLSGTIFRLYVPPGFVINIFNTIEISSAAGICINVRLLP